LTAQQQRRRQQRRRQQRRRQQRRRQQRQHQQRRQRRQPPQRTTWDPQWAPPGLRTSGAGAAIAQQRRPWLGGLGVWGAGSFRGARRISGAAVLPLIHVRRMG
jgi:hypothetical protein